MKQTRHGSPGRRKRQAAKLLDPASEDWRQNMDVNLFRSDAKHPWLDLACAVKRLWVKLAGSNASSFPLNAILSCN
jgi:hypothetical protein